MQLLAYADHVDIKVHETKTKQMVASNASTDQGHRHIDQNFTIGDQNYGVNNEFVYLRSLVNSTNNVFRKLEAQLYRTTYMLETWVILKQDANLLF